MQKLHKVNEGIQIGVLYPAYILQGHKVQVKKLENPREKVIK